MIRFVVTTGHHGPLRATRQACASLPVEIWTYDRLIAAKRLRAVTTVFADIDRLARGDLELAALVHRSLAAAKVPVLNDPARVKTRYGLLRSLHEAGLNDFNVYRADEERLPKRYPVFVRRDSGHGEPLSGLLDDRDALLRALDAAIESGVPAGNLLIVEYAAEPVAPGVFRKLATTRIGDRLLPQSSVHDDHWLVKYGRAGVASEALYRDEARLLEQMPYADQLWRAFEIAAISYGRADFGLVDGRVQIYEINTNPSVKPGKPHPSKLRQANLAYAWNAHLAALRDLDAKHAGGGVVALRHKRLRKFQGPRLRRHRTRKAL